MDIIIIYVTGLYVQYFITNLFVTKNDYLGKVGRFDEP